MVVAKKYADDNGVDFSHYALVSSDTVPLKPLSDVGSYDAQGNAQSTFAPYEEPQQVKHKQQMDHALGIWRELPAFVASPMNKYARSFHEFPSPGHSQWWVMNKADVVFLLRDPDDVYDMAQMYDQLFDVYRDGAKTNITPLAPDEVVFLRTLMLNPDTTHALPVEYKIMAEDTGHDEDDPEAGKHAKEFASVSALQNACEGSDVAWFGRKIFEKISPNQLDTWA